MTLRFCDSERKLEELAAGAQAFDRVVAAGGDGTASALCYALRETGVPILVYPAGTANLLAQNLGMPVEPRQLADMTLNGSVVEFDLGELERASTSGPGTVKSGFAVMAGAGYDAAIIEGAAPFKANMGAAAYLFAAVSNLAPTPAHFVLDMDGEEVVTDGIAVLVMNFGRLQFDLPIALGADPRDGLLQVAILRQRSVAALVPAVVAGFSGADKLPGVDVYTAKRVTVMAEPALSIQYDGETLAAVTPFTARALPRATTLLVPADSEYAG